MHTVGVLAFDGMTAFHLSIPSLVFGNRAIPRGCGYRVEICTERPGVLATDDGFDITVRADLSVLDRAQTIVVPSWHRDIEPSPPVRAALRSAQARGARVVGLCLGAFAVAASGIVDGREVATHWAAADELARRYPRVRVRSDVLWCDLGDVVTSAGIAAALDCCLHVVRADHGAAIAAEVARVLVLAPHRAGSQAQFIPTAVPRLRADDPIDRAMTWARTRLDEPIDLDGWAAAAAMSRRTFTRRFRERTAASPVQWLLHQRLDRAKVLLETTDDTVERIAARCGFGSAVTLRHHFHRRLGTTPQAHRASFSRPFGG
jgi:transcriptional regulator GlxA family with amidase domain